MHARPRSPEPPGVARAAICALLLVVLLRLAAPILIPLAMAVVAVLLLSVTAEWLQERGVPAPLGAGALVGLTLAVLMGLGLLLHLEVGDWHTWAQTPSVSASRAGQSGGAYGDAVARWLQNEFADNVGKLTSQADRAMHVATFYVASASMLAFFALMSQRSLLLALIESVPGPRARVRLLGGLREARRGIGAYLLTSGLMNLGLALATTLALVSMGVSNLALWATAIFALLFIPYLGPLAISVLLFVGAHSSAGGVFKTVAPPVIFLALHGIEAVLISPWLVGRNLRVSRVSLMASVLVFGAAWGLSGALLAVPMLIVARAVVRRTKNGWRLAILFRPERRSASPLRYSALRFGAASSGDDPEPVQPLLPPRERRLPNLTLCESPTSPKPTPLKSTASP
jgi:predicted PurR-regulated permease PerM